MDIKDVHGAKTRFSRLLARVAAGEERKGGEWRGLIRIRDDFDAPLPADLAAAFRGEEE